MRKKTLIRTGFILIILFITLELTLRFVFGFSDSVLFREDKDFEYIPLPQNRVRFGNKISYNNFSQRNDAISKGDSVICLGIGDSVFNGGTQIDQDSLASTKLTAYLTEKYNRKALFANISAPSWGPDNGFAYLKKYGSFGASKILLVVSSHDAHDEMTFEPVVNKHPSYPSKQYKLATAELVDRYIIGRYVRRYFKSDTSTNNELMIKQSSGDEPLVSAFANYKAYCDTAGIELTVYLHPEISELRAHEYNQAGKKIIAFCESNNVRLIKELDYKFPEDAYLDDIHLSDNGQRYMFDVLKKIY
ncbi:MAG: hypothetical protein EOO04_00535 [Chitinophagaceae bacterium]|nr:MAG: hypothetical protein EOO04_00535 [Chitinophagaceae bacterium]